MPGSRGGRTRACGDEPSRSWRPLLAAGGEQSHQRGDALPLHRVVDVPLFLPALEQPRAAEDVEMMGQRGSRNLDRLLDLSHRHLSLRLHEEEEHLKATEMREGLERLD